MKKILSLLIIVALLPNFVLAQQTSTLTVDNYLAQVKQSNPNMESAILLEEAADELQNEGRHLYTPNLFADYAHVYDRRPTLIPAFQGNKTVQDILNLGVKQQTGFGLQSSVYYAMNSSTIYGVDPLFYPQPHLNVQSINLELKQSLLQNGFGRSTRAVVNSRNAQTMATLYQQKFLLKSLLQLKQKHDYWELVDCALICFRSAEFTWTARMYFIASTPSELNLNLIDSMLILVASRSCTETT
jgi:hypothetical protein